MISVRSSRRMSQHPDPEQWRGAPRRLQPLSALRFFGTPPVDGALWDCVTIGSAFAHPVPDSVLDDAAALREPLLGLSATKLRLLSSGCFISARTPTLSSDGQSLEREA
jgi:L-iditol 2-dehydrogenase